MCLSLYWVTALWRKGKCFSSLLHTVEWQSFFHESTSTDHIKFSVIAFYAPFPFICHFSARFCSYVNCSYVPFCLAKEIKRYSTSFSCCMPLFSVQYPEFGKHPSVSVDTILLNLRAGEGTNHLVSVFLCLQIPEQISIGECTICRANTPVTVWLSDLSQAQDNNFKKLFAKKLWTLAWSHLYTMIYWSSFPHYFRHFQLIWV